MSELSALLSVPVGEIKLQDKVYTLYKLKLNDFAYLESKHKKSLQDIFNDSYISRSLDFILDILYLSIKKGDATITKEFIGECLDLTSPELIEITQNLLTKIISGESANNPLQGRKAPTKSADQHSEK